MRCVIILQLLQPSYKIPVEPLFNPPPTSIQPSSHPSCHSYQKEAPHLNVVVTRSLPYFHDSISPSLLNSEYVRSHSMLQDRDSSRLRKAHGTWFVFASSCFDTADCRIRYRVPPSTKGRSLQPLEGHTERRPQHGPTWEPFGQGCIDRERRALHAAYLPTRTWLELRAARELPLPVR